MQIKCNLCKKIVKLKENLTIPQIKALKFIQKYNKNNKKSPSYEDIKKGLGYKTKSAGFILVDALIQKQYLAKSNYKKRSLIIIKEFPCE